MADEHLHAEHIHDHEHTDMSIAAVAWFFAGLLISGIFIHLITAGLLSYFESHKEGGEAVSPYAPPRELPPAPRLLVNPREDLRQFRAKEDEILSTYGWVDKSKGIVRIPIDRAIELVGQRGLPSSPAPAAPGGLPRNPLSATRADVTNPRGTNINPGNPGAFPLSNPPSPSAPPSKQQPSGGAQR